MGTTDVPTPTEVTLVSENERITAPVTNFSAVVYTRRSPARLKEVVYDAGQDCA
jgi:hypothetical protein